MKTFIIKFLGLALIFTAFVACSDDDDPPVVIDNVMVVCNSDTGMFSAINITDGTLTDLGSITFEGEPLIGLRDIVYNPSNRTVYVSNRSDFHNGAIFSVNPETLVATVINDNAEDDWYALPGIEMDNGKIIGTVYWDYFDLDYSTGLVWLNLDGSINSFVPLMFEGEEVHFSEGMALEYSPSMDEIFISDDEDIMISDLNGNVTGLIDMTAVGLPMDDSLDGFRTLETDDNGTLYGIDRDGHFGSIDLTAGVFTYIATLPSNKIMALSNIPENIFN